LHIIFCLIWGSHSGTTNSTIFWIVTPRTSVEVHGRYCFHHQGRKLSQANIWIKFSTRGSFSLFLDGYLIGLFIDPDDGSSYVLPKYMWISIRLHGVISQYQSFFCSQVCLYTLRIIRFEGPTSGQ
jgi:hypothetical protein